MLAHGSHSTLGFATTCRRLRSVTGNNPLYHRRARFRLSATTSRRRIGFAYAAGRATVRWWFTEASESSIPRFRPCMRHRWRPTTEFTASQVFLDNMKPAQAAVFPKYPAPLVNCPSGAMVCTPPASIASFVTTQVSAFAPNFQTPYTEQANLTPGARVRRQARRLRQLSLRSWRASLRSLDVNLPEPTITEYPVYNDGGSVFLGTYY